jgi:hypothetical protein
VELAGPGRPAGLKIATGRLGSRWRVRGGPTREGKKRRIGPVSRPKISTFGMRLKFTKF